MFWRCVRIAILLVALSAIAGDYDELRRKSLEFEKHWNPYIRRLYGCRDAGPTDAQHCAGTPTVDYREFAAAKKAAKHLFTLHE